jgi:hypothetical protein
MQREWRDAIATAPVLVTVALYVDFLADGTAMWIHGPRTMALTALLLGLSACIVGGWTATKSAMWVSAPFGVVALVLAILTLITGNVVTLAFFLAVIAALWLISTVRHLRLA